jgi:hypothetical protein
MEVDIEFDVGLTGFSIAEVDQLVEGLAHEEGGDPADDRLPDPNKVEARCRPGDIWRLGSHRLVCGDSLDPAVVSGSVKTISAFSPSIKAPYNVAIDGNVSGLGTIRHREFAMASGEMTRDEFTAFLSAAFANLVAHSHDGSIHFVCTPTCNTAPTRVEPAPTVSQGRGFLEGLTDPSMIVTSNSAGARRAFGDALGLPRLEASKRGAWRLGGRWLEPMAYNSQQAAPGPPVDERRRVGS